MLELVKLDCGSTLNGCKSSENRKNDQEKHEEELHF